MGKNIKTKIGAFSELEIYQIALKDYKRSNGPFKWLFPKLCFTTSGGFCYYFKSKFDLNIEWLYHLVLLKPNFGGAYWFTEGYRKPRIELLEKVIIKIKSNN